VKVCTGCKQEKQLSEYWPDKRRKNRLMARCKNCRRSLQKAYRSANPDLDYRRYWSDPQSERERHLLRKYGLDQIGYDALLNEQDGKCAVCRKTQEKAFDVDHDHKTGLVRGLLCTSCNRMIGHAGDIPETLEVAAVYLRSSRK
jgi:transcription elongation factor Elf1